MFEAIAMLVLGIVSAISTWRISKANNEANLKAQEMANATNIGMTESTNETNYNIWRESMEYNSPSNQIRMLRDAGINPIVAYGSVSSGNRSIPISMESPKVFPIQSDVSGMVGGIESLFSNLQSSILNKEQVELMREQVDSQKFSNELNQLTKDQQILKYALDNELIDASTHEKMNNIINKKLELYLQGQTVESSLKLNAEQIRLMGTQIDNEVLRGDILEIQKGMLGIELMYKENITQAELDAKIKQAAYIGKQIEKLKVDIANGWKDYNIKEQTEILNGLMIDAQAIENDIREKYKDITDEELKIKKNEAILSALTNKLEGIQYLISTGTMEAAQRFIDAQSRNEDLKPLMDILKIMSGAVNTASQTKTGGK